MIIQLEKNQLFNTFGVDCFSSLETIANSMAPSMVEYYLSDLSLSSDNNTYINRSNIQQTISLDEYSLYLDYSEDIYMEFIKKEDQYETDSLW
ncbi:MAG: hypothetical protein U9O56_10135 [Campylobacterota bacterium]|nr:hypothetical protein [Campylobacterota bacterium]